MSGRKVNFILGPTRSGKTTFCHFLTGTELSYEKKGYIYKIETVQPPPAGMEIGHTNVAQTSEVQDFGNFLDFPGFEDTRGIDFDLRTLIQLRNKFEEFGRIRLILIIERCKIEGANGADITKITNDFINLLGLTKKEVPGIKLVVTKTNKKFCKTIPDSLKELCANSSNFIIDAIINQEIQIIAFEKPSEYFDIKNKETRFRFIEQFERNDYLYGKEFINNINKAIENKLILIKLGDKRYPDIVFASETKFTNKLESDFLLCIDCNKDIDEENLEINAPNIVVIHKESFDINSPNAVVLSQEKKKLLWQIKGLKPSVNFSDEIKNVINGEKLVIATRSSSKIEFPDPFSEEFNKNTKFFRLESACVNGYLLENVGYNNQFIDLIVYLNYNLGEIKINPNFKIEAITIDVRLKFNVNECMRTKSGILKKFLSIRMCKDIEEYKNRCGKDLNSDCIKALENYVLKLPTIFQILVDSNHLRHFNKNPQAKNDLFSIRHILLENYIRMMDEINKKKLESIPKELHHIFFQLRNDYMAFENFCLRKNFVTKEELSLLNRLSICNLNSFLYYESLSHQDYLDFFSFYDTLNITPLKKFLHDYNVTADISNFHNYQSKVNKNKQIHNLNNYFEGNSETLMVLLSFLGAKLFTATVGTAAGLFNIIKTSSEAGARTREAWQAYQLGKSSLDTLIASKNLLDLYNFGSAAEKILKYKSLVDSGTAAVSTGATLVGSGTIAVSSGSTIVGASTTAAVSSGFTGFLTSAFTMAGPYLLGLEVVKLGTCIIRIFAISGYYDVEFVPDLNIFRVDI